MTTEDRFFAKVAINAETGCHEWTAATSGVGHHRYGVFGLNGKSIKAHRYAYERVHGPIPAGLVIDHLCRNTRCVNPAHLEAVSPQENQRRMKRKGSKAVCDHGHPMTADNVYVRPDGSPSCKQCRRSYGMARYFRHAESDRLPQHSGLTALAFL